MESKCTVLFLDEIDAIGQSRGGSASGGEDSCSRRVLAELLMQLNKISDPSSVLDSDISDPYDADDDESVGGQSQERAHLPEGGEETSSQFRVIVAAATNRKEDCDPALLRRFGIQIHVKLPTASDRRRILKKLLKDVSHKVAKKELTDLAGALEGWSGSDLESLAREAAMAPVRECIRAAARQKRLARLLSSDPNGNLKRQSIDPHQQARVCLLEGFQVSLLFGIAPVLPVVVIYLDTHLGFCSF